jgi:hypothetical protein
MTIMTLKKKGAIGALVVTAIALGVLVPLALAGGKHTATTHRAALAVACQTPTAPTPAFPLEMNTVATGLLVKTVAMEKEILSCNDVNGPVTRDIETFIEVIDKENATPTVAFLAARLVISTCDKRNTTIPSITCGKTAPNLPSVSNFSLGDCRLLTPQLNDPVEMNTVRTDDGKVVKTIKVEKEIYACNDSSRIGDLYVFTQVIEPLNAAGDNFATAGVRYLGVFCTKNPSTGLIEGCVRFTPGVLQ